VFSAQEPPPPATDSFGVEFTGHIFWGTPPDPLVDMGLLVATGTATIDRGDPYVSEDGRLCAHFEIVAMTLTGTLQGIPVVVTAGRGLLFDVPTSTGVICEGAPESDIDLDLYIVVEVQDPGGTFYLINVHNRIMSNCYCGGGTGVPAQEACLDLCTTSPSGETCANSGTEFPLVEPTPPYTTPVAEVQPSEEEETCALLFGPVGGIAELPGTTAGPESPAEFSSGSGFNYAALGGALAAVAVVVLAAGAWLARRRWVR
jgi:hypothetical protein